MVDPTPIPTRERLLSTALRLFWEKGYNSTSVADILREAEANSGSLYHYFPTKQDVLVGVLEQYRDGIEPMLLQPVWDGVEDPIEKVFALLQGYRRLLLESDFRLGCPIGNIALEIAEPDPVVRARLVENFEGWVAAVKDCFDEAGHRFPPGTDTLHLARFCLVSMEGGVMVARSYRDIGPFDEMVATLRDYLERMGVMDAASESRGPPSGGQADG
jgi:TetR/AcrR family transcriptional regulator, transcriptional repressor for nem operon